MTIVPLIIGAMVTFYSHFKTEIEKIQFENWKLEQNEMQKIALLGTVHIVRSFLQIAWLFFA